MTATRNALAGPAPPGPSLFWRGLHLAWRNPRMVQGLLREAYRQKWGLARDRRRPDGFSALPVSLSLDLTRRCNLKCLMCEQQRQVPGPAGLSWYDSQRELPLEVWLRLLDQTASFLPRLYLTGGEPTLYRHFRPLVAEAKRRGYLVQVQTNGTLLEELAGFLVDQGVEIVTVSVDGPAQVHDRIRGRQGAFSLTRKGLEALAHARRLRTSPGPIVVLNCVISKANMGALDEMAPLAMELGADILQFQHTMFNSRANVESHNRWLSPEVARARGLELTSPSIPAGEYYESEISADDLPLLRQGLQLARRQAGNRLKVAFLPNLPAQLLEPYYLNLDHPFPPACNALWQTCRILPDGTVSNCLHVVAGNIATESFQEIWNGPRIRRFRQMIRRRLLPGCVRCCDRSFT